VDLTGHPKLLTPAAANAIALAEQPLHHHGHTEDNGGGGGSGGGGSTPHVVFLVDEYEEEEREDASYYNGDFTSSEPFNFSAFSNDLPFLKNLKHASSSDISNSDSMSGGSVEEDKPVRVPVVSFSLPSDEPLSPPPSSSSSSPSSSSTENKGGNLRGKAKQFMRSLNIFGNSRRRERESESDGASPSAAAAADNSNPSWPNELSPRRRGSFKEKKKRRK
jgi:hypothetical protein